jgi:hypothetical protein
MAWRLGLPMPPVGMTRRSVSSSHQAAYPVVGGEKMREKAEKSRLFREDGIVCFLLPLGRVGRGYAPCMDEHEERSEAERVRTRPGWSSLPVEDRERVALVLAEVLASAWRDLEREERVRRTG